MSDKSKDKQKAGDGSPLTATAGSALVRRCDVCGTINAIDLAPNTPGDWRDMQLPDHTVLTVGQEEALRLWKTGGRCDHKKMIADLRAAVSSQNSG